MIVKLTIRFLRSNQRRIMINEGKIRSRTRKKDSTRMKLLIRINNPPMMSIRLGNRDRLSFAARIETKPDSAAKVAIVVNVTLSKNKLSDKRMTNIPKNL